MPDHRETSFGDYIYELRHGRGLSLRDLAKLSGISFGRLGEIERGVDSHSGLPFVPSYMSVTRLARALGHPPADLLRLAGHEPGVELEPEEWALVGIYRGLPEEKRRELSLFAEELAGDRPDSRS